MTEVRLGLPAELEAARGPDGVADAAEVELAVQRYLALNPGSDRHLTIIQVGSKVFSTRDGPPDLQQLQRENGLPPGVGGTLTTVGLLLDSIIVAPSVGAPALRLTVTRTPMLLPPTTVFGASVTEEIGIFCEGAETVSVAVFVAPP